MDTVAASRDLARVDPRNTNLICSTSRMSRRASGPSPLAKVGLKALVGRRVHRRICGRRRELPSGRSFKSERLRFLAEHLNRLEALLVIRENRVGHFSRRLGAAQPLRAELQGRSSRSETLEDERSPGRQVLFYDPSFLDIRDFIIPDIALDRYPLDGQAVEYADVPHTDPLRGRRPVDALYGRQPSGSLVEIDHQLIDLQHRRVDLHRHGIIPKLDHRADSRGWIRDGFSYPGERGVLILDFPDCRVLIVRSLPRESARGLLEAREIETAGRCENVLV